MGRGNWSLGNWAIGRKPNSATGWDVFFIPLLFLLPVTLSLLWGRYFTDDAYIPLHYAQTLAGGRGLTAFAGDVPPLHSPLWTAVLTLAAFLHLPLTYTALLLSAIGWGTTAVLLYQTLRQQLPPSPRPSLSEGAGASLLPLTGGGLRWGSNYYPILHFLPALLLVLNPIVIRTAGTEIPWLLAAALLAMRSTAVLPLLPLIHFNWPTGVLIIILFGLHYWQTRRNSPSLTSNRHPWIMLILTTISWAAISWWLFGRLPLDFVMDDNTTIVAATAVTATALFLFMGWALAWLFAHLRSKVTLSPEETAVGLALLIGIPWLAAQGTLLWQQSRLRPLAYQQLQMEISQSLREDIGTDALLFGSAQIGFLAQRPIWRWQGQRDDENYLPRLLNRFIQQPPDIFIAADTLPWDQLIHTGWFRERYRALDSFQSAYETRSPFTIWAYQQTAFDQTAIQTPQVQTENGLNLVSYQYGPPTIAANEALYVTLYWQTTQPITTTFNTVVRLISPWDQVAWAQRDLRSPRSLPPSWLEPGDWFAERFVLTTTADIPIGGFELNLSLYETRSGEFINLYQDNDNNALDRVILGRAAVPWPGDVASAAIPAPTFGNQIQLVGYERSGDFQPGATVTAKLYWQALTPPPAHYVVFVHLLDENGTLVTNHDSPPAFGTFPTRTWSPGFIIPDEHPLTLPADLPHGRYQIKVGLYLPESGERLTVIDANGTELGDRAFEMEMLEVGD